MSLDATALVTLAETKLHLNIPTADTTNDAELELYINAVTVIVEKRTGPVVNRDVTETVPGGSTLFLSSPPAVSLTAVAGAHGDTTSYTEADLYLDGPAGVVYPAYGSANFGPTHVTVTYVAGRGATAPSAIKLAALIVLKHLWETQRGASLLPVQGFGDEAATTFGLGFALPNRALELLAPYPRPTGVA